MVSQTWSAPIDPAQECPDAADIVIIGGGIIGVSTAYFLAKSGHNVVVCEKGRIACEQSSRNWGWIRKQRRHESEMPIMIRSIEIWKELNEQMSDAIGFHQGGVLCLGRTEKQMAYFEECLKHDQIFGIDTCIVKPSQIEDIVDTLPDGFLGGLYTASDGRAEPHTAVPAIARLAEKHGAKVLTGCAVRGIEKASGKVSSVVTERGTIKTDVAVCAGGAWSSLFCHSLGVSLPQLLVRNTVARTEPTKLITSGNIRTSSVALRRRQDGGYTVKHGLEIDHILSKDSFRYFKNFFPALCRQAHEIHVSPPSALLQDLDKSKRWSLDSQSPFERTRVLNPKPSKKFIDKMHKGLSQDFPALKDVKIEESWAGMIDATPDILPVMSSCDGVSGLFIATGFSGHGFGLGPGAGEIIAKLVTNDNTGVDMKPFRLSRFSDGTKLELGPTL
jgi:glycine/D-amino acid oxidase-like deaminating enzyme